MVFYLRRYSIQSLTRLPIFYQQNILKKFTQATAIIKGEIFLQYGLYAFSLRRFKRKLFDFIGFNGDKSLKQPIKHRFLTLNEEVFILNENSR